VPQNYKDSEDRFSIYQEIHEESLEIYAYTHLHEVERKGIATEQCPNIAIALVRLRGASPDDFDREAKTAWLASDLTQTEMTSLITCGLIRLEDLSSEQIAMYQKTAGLEGEDEQNSQDWKPSPVKQPVERKAIPLESGPHSILKIAEKLDCRPSAIITMIMAVELWHDQTYEDQLTWFSPIPQTISLEGWGKRMDDLTNISCTIGELEREINELLEFAESAINSGRWKKEDVDSLLAQEIDITEDTMIDRDYAHVLMRNFGVCPFLPLRESITVAQWVEQVENLVSQVCFLSEGNNQEFLELLKFGAVAIDSGRWLQEGIVFSVFASDKMRERFMTWFEHDIDPEVTDSEPCQDPKNSIKLHGDLFYYLARLGVLHRVHIKKILDKEFELGLLSLSQTTNIVGQGLLLWRSVPLAWCDWWRGFHIRQKRDHFDPVVLQELATRVDFSRVHLYLDEAYELSVSGHTVSPSQVSIESARSVVMMVACGVRTFSPEELELVCPEVIGNSLIDFLEEPIFRRDAIASPLLKFLAEEGRPRIVSALCLQSVLEPDDIPEHRRQRWAKSCLSTDLGDLIDAGILKDEAQLGNEE